VFSVETLRDNVTQCHGQFSSVTWILPIVTAFWDKATGSSRLPVTRARARACYLSDGADHVEEVGAVLRHRLHIVEGKLGLFDQAMRRD
jgi:hypothetical protein